MNTYDTDDLRRMLAAEAAENSPEMLGMVPSVVAAAPARRKRNAFQAAAVAVAVVAAAVTVPLVVDGGGKPTRHLPAAPTAPPAPSPVVLAATVEPGHGFVLGEEGFVGTTQKFSVRPETADPSYGGGILSVFAPGTFDLTPYAVGEPVTVQGQPGYYVDRFPFKVPAIPEGDIEDKPDDPAGDGLSTQYDTRVAWQDPSGYVLVLTQFDQGYRDQAMRLVQAVRIAPRPATAPVAFSDVPGGVRLEIARLGSTTALTFVSGGTPPLQTYEHVMNAEDAASVEGFTLIMQPRPGMNHAVPVDVPPVRVGEADIWYQEDPAKSVVSFGPNQSGTLIATDTCVGNIYVKDKAQIPRAAVEAFIASIDFRDCTNPATWAPLQR